MWYTKRTPVRGKDTDMTPRLSSSKLTQLQNLDAVLAREIRGQSQVLPRISSVIRRGELGLSPDNS